ncbi:DNA replication terminus site-binding protein [Shewanella inventionis]|uniref:DNA replication terminus site-binding protein n=1 Tax=Shewanella inventionis TaxID=1738770 RepID=A0ABQ1JHE3_9GAMM|nr:DNA replication terminus site-binding protein [Shewanella inventionis]GGB66390.1 DNA replication terminus site-binding protein [Shewanella inventionis]
MSQLPKFLSEQEYSKTIKSELDKLTMFVKQLNAHLDSMKVRSCQLYKIAEQQLDKTISDKAFDGSQEIDVLVVDDDFTAFIEAKKSYYDFFNHCGTTSKNTYRAAGYIQISIKDNPKEQVEALIELCDLVNMQKKVLAELFKADLVTDEDMTFDRNNFFLSYFPHLIKLQVTRHLRVINDDSINNIDFHWSSKTLSDKTTPSEMIAKINRMVDRLNRTADYSANADLKVKALIITAQHLSALSNDVELRLRRPIPPQPSVNIRRKGAKLINFTCPIPFILISDDIDVTGLKNFKPRTNKDRNNKKYHCIDSSLNLYGLTPNKPAQI